MDIPKTNRMIWFMKGMSDMKTEKISPQEQKRNDAYNEYVKQVTPTHNLWLNMLKAFLLGGLICTIGQVIVNTGINNFGLEQKEASTWCSLILILSSVILTSLNLYPSLANWGGAGALVPITGFANAVVSPASDCRSEGIVLGVGTTIFTVAGPVLLYGILSGSIYGIIYWIVGLF